MATKSPVSGSLLAPLSPNFSAELDSIDGAASQEDVVDSESGHPLSYHPFPQAALDRRRFVTLQVLGHGAYAWVEEVRDNEDGATLAMKVVPAPPDRRSRIETQVHKEVKILRKISGHCHIVRFQHTFADARGFYVLVAPVADCDLSMFYGRCAVDDFPEEMIRRVRMWFSCLAHGLAYIHSHRVRHKDIKPQNILIKDGNVLFADFGLSKDFAELEELNSTTEGYTPKTPMYAAPEVIQHMQRRYSADIFSLGCVYAELASVLARKSVASFFDFRVKRDPETGIVTHAFHNTLHLVSDWLSCCNLSIRQMISSMLKEDPLDRPRATDLQASIIAAVPELATCSHLPVKRNSSARSNDPSSKSAAPLPLSGRGKEQFERQNSHQGSAKAQVATAPHSSRGFASRHLKASSPPNAHGLYQHANLSEESLSVLNQMRLVLNAREERSSEIITNSVAGEEKSPESSSNQVKEHASGGSELSCVQNDDLLQENIAKGAANHEAKQLASRGNPHDTFTLPISSRNLVSAPTYVLVLLGDGGVGKTALVTSFLFGQVFEGYDPTIEDSYRKNVYINEKPHCLQIIDTAGQDAHSALREQRIAEADAFLVVYSITSRASFDRVTEFANQICRSRGANFPSRCCTLVGTKSDLVDDREVSTEEGSERAGELGYVFTETSAVSNQGIKETFLGAVSAILSGG